jgi:hypothetical protein
LRKDLIRDRLKYVGNQVGVKVFPHREASFREPRMERGVLSLP